MLQKKIRLEERSLENTREEILAGHTWAGKWDEIEPIMQRERENLKTRDNRGKNLQ